MAVISFKCPNCDGELIFDPSTQKYKCEYCFSLFSQEELDAMKPAQTTEPQNADAAGAGKASGKPEDKKQSQLGNKAGSGTEKDNTENKESDKEAGKEADAVTYTCPSCGAQIVTDATTAATFCYYCHNPVVLGGRLEGKFLPDQVIPFSVSREDAEKGFKDYVCKKKFVLRAFYNKKQVESITGVYFPYWHYNTRLEGKMQGEARNVRVWRTGNTEYTETKYYQVSREGDVKLENLTENALGKANQELICGVMPYDFKDVKKFQLGFLSGFLAEKRDIEKKQIEKKVQQEARESAEKLMREQINGYSSVSVKNADFRALKEKWSYTLLPVWTITYKSKNGKIYYFSMNGQTGKVYGELPIDYKKISLVSGIVSLVTLVILLLGGLA